MQCKLAVAINCAEELDTKVNRAEVVIGNVHDKRNNSQTKNLNLIFKLESLRQALPKTKPNFLSCISVLEKKKNAKKNCKSMSLAMAQHSLERLYKVLYLLQAMGNKLEVTKVQLA